MKTTFKILRQEDVWQPKMGPPRGNRNALKTGAHTRQLRDLRKQVTAARRVMKVLIARGKSELNSLAPAKRGRGQGQG